MDSSRGMSTVQRLFSQRLILFYIFLGLFILMETIQTLLYGVVASVTPCEKVQLIFYLFMGSEILMVLVPLTAFISIFLKKQYSSSIFYTGLNFLIKIAVIVSVMLVSQQHIETCYIPKNVKIGIAIANVSQIICLAIVFFMMRRLKKFNRQIKIQGVINAKKFQIGF